MNHINKPIKTAVAVLLKHPYETNKFLIIRRSPDDENLPNEYGLPAGSITNGELPEQVVERIGSEKLCTEIEAVRFIGAKYIDRGDFILILMVIEARLIANEPNVLASKSPNSRYVEQKWTDDYSMLIQSASKGGLCSQIVLDREGIGY